MNHSSHVSRVIVTGGSGKVGRAWVEDLIQHGYEVFNLDLVRPAKELCRFIQKRDACSGTNLNTAGANRKRTSPGPSH